MRSLHNVSHNQKVIDFGQVQTCSRIKPDDGIYGSPICQNNLKTVNQRVMDNTMIKENRTVQNDNQHYRENQRLNTMNLTNTEMNSGIPEG